MNKIILARELQVGHTVSTADGRKWKIVAGVRGKFDVLVWDKVLPEQSWLNHIKDEKGKNLRKLTLEAIRISDGSDGEPIDVDKDPFAYNKEFNPEDPTHFAQWNKHMRPKHIRPEVWLYKIAELKLMLEGKSSEERGQILYGWKVQNQLIRQ